MEKGRDDGGRKCYQSLHGNLSQAHCKVSLMDTSDTWKYLVVVKCIRHVNYNRHKLLQGMLHRRNDS